MKLRRSSISKLALMICGDNQYQDVFPYRSSSYLTAFFRDIDLPFVHHGETRRWWVESILDGINEKTDIAIEYFPHPDLVKIIEHLVEPSEFRTRQNQENAITLLNETLIRERLSISVAEGLGVAKLIRRGENNEHYDVALSFAGEDREYVKDVAEFLKKENINVFYDYFEQIDLWGKDLATHLSLIYGKKSKTVIIFISKNYYNKIYPRHEFHAALSKAIASRVEYLLPAKFDDTDIPGIPKTVKYIDLRNYDPSQFAQMIIEKLRLLESV